MNVNTGYLLLKTDKKITESATKLRGYIGRQFQDNLILHNHENQDLIYSYPLVQYKIIENNAILYGLEEGLSTIKEISSDINELKLTNTYQIKEKILYEKEFELEESNKLHQYQFVTPWIALNQKNYQKYKKISNQKECKIFLNKILIGNILSMAKSFGIMVEKRLIVKSFLNITDVTYKSVVLKAFTGEFQTNFKLPDYMGLGKGVSHGYGTIINNKI
ncbi:MAG: hypothetical protein IJJ47_03445 [Methanosphaera sp.]|nr:hypothetical protein [Methanosphaera sp.]